MPRRVSFRKVYGVRDPEKDAARDPEYLCEMIPAIGNWIPECLRDTPINTVYTPADVRRALARPIRSSVVIKAY